MDFEIIGEISDVEIIAVSGGITDIARLRRVYGRGRWRKLKGVARVQLRNGKIRQAYTVRLVPVDLGKREIKRKRYLD
jgi:hypothetical protein